LSPPLRPCRKAGKLNFHFRISIVSVKLFTDPKENGALLLLHKFVQQDVDVRDRIEFYFSMPSSEGVDQVRSTGVLAQGGLCKPQPAVRDDSQESGH
jgi:hypothetical protein